MVANRTEKALEGIERILGSIDRRVSKIEEKAVTKYTQQISVTPPASQLPGIEVLDEVPVEIDWISPTIKGEARLIFDHVRNRFKIEIYVDGEDAAIAESVVRDDRNFVEKLSISSVAR